MSENTKQLAPTVSRILAKANAIVVLSRWKQNRVNPSEIYFNSRNERKTALSIQIIYLLHISLELWPIEILEVLGHHAEGKSAVTQGGCDFGKRVPPIVGKR